MPVLDVACVTTVEVRAVGEVGQAQASGGASARQLFGEVSPFHPVLLLSPTSAPRQEATVRPWPSFHSGATVST